MSKYGAYSAHRAAFGGPPRRPPSPKEPCQGCGKGRVLMNFPLYAQKGQRERLCSVCIQGRSEAERKAWAIRFGLARWSPAVVAREDAALAVRG